MSRVGSLVAATLPLLVTTGTVAGGPPHAPGDYRWERAAPALDRTLVPVAATRCDRDRDGNPEPAVAWPKSGV